MLSHDLVGRLGTFNRLVARATVEFLAAFQRRTEPFARFATFSPATSAVAAIRARASSARVPTSLLIACISLFILLVFM